MSNRPLWPEDGMTYYLAMQEAQKLYDDWVKSRKGGNGNRKGITVYSRKQLDKEND